MGKKLLLGLVGAGALAATVFHKKENKNKDEEHDHNEHNKEGE